MESKFWDERYNEPGFAYGLEANDYLVSISDQLKPNSNILCIAEGEGRNAIYLAKQGHQVTAIDYSFVGLDKLSRYAALNSLQIETIHQDLNHYEFEENKWDVIVCIFGHFNKNLREKVFKSVYNSLKADGIFIMESYSELQLKNNTGGPQALEMLYSIDELATYFNNYSNIRINKTERMINEGKYHNGKSSTIQILAKK